MTVPSFVDQLVEALLFPFALYLLVVDVLLSVEAWLLIAVLPVKTILGAFSWDERVRPINKSFIMTQWQDGKLEFVYPTDAFPGVKPLVYPKPEW